MRVKNSPILDKKRKLKKYDIEIIEDIKCDICKINKC